MIAQAIIDDGKLYGFYVSVCLPVSFLQGLFYYYYRLSIYALVSSFLSFCINPVHLTELVFFKFLSTQLNICVSYCHILQGGNTGQGRHPHFDSGSVGGTILLSKLKCVYTPPLTFCVVQVEKNFSRNTIIIRNWRIKVC